MGSNGHSASPGPRNDKGKIVYAPTGLGRPSLFRPEFCDMVIAAGEQGKSVTEMAAGLGVARATMLEWATQHGDFSTALARARDLSLAWWEAHGREHLTADKYQAQVWRTWMAAHSEEYREAARPGVNVNFNLADLVSRSLTVIDAQPVLTLPVDPDTSDKPKE